MNEEDYAEISVLERVSKLNYAEFSIDFADVMSGFLDK